MTALKQPYPFLGVLMLDTAFPRVLGDAGNAASYACPVRIMTIPGAGALDVVKPGRPNDKLLKDFITAARQLEKDGAVALVSTCGFLVHFQGLLARSVGIPVMVSALSLYPMLQTAFGQRPIGLLTASAASLVNGGLGAADIDPDHVHIVGFEGCAAFASAILTSEPASAQAFDSVAIRAYAIDAARKLVQQRPEIGCLLLECGNLPPYAADLQAATGRPVFSILDAARMLWSASNPERFGPV